MKQKLMLFFLGGILVLLSLYIHRLPFVPLEKGKSKVLSELSSTKPLELLNPKTGLLNHEGWSKYPNKWMYHQEMSKAPGISKKNWNYFYIASDNYLVTMAHLDLGFIKGSYINIRDIANMDSPMIQVKIQDFDCSIVKSICSMIFPKNL
mmetsp:Transcript_38583/g.38103  ORF Transcript_38583/g.38103 Transcript_38583/m.38103 type:complete len:150 (+) Transcript_38583:2-451(+)